MGEVELRKKVEETSAGLRSALRDYRANVKKPPYFLFAGPAPKIEASLLNSCKLLSDRDTLIAQLPAGGLGVEVGTQTGRFAEVIIRKARPKKLWTLDISYASFAWSKMQQYIDQGVLEVLEGRSANLLAKFDDEYFDFIYIDGDHSYQGVSDDIQVSYQKLRKGGLMIFNDFTSWSPFEGTAYGVYRAVCEAAKAYQMPFEYLALAPFGYHDAALRRV
jgi:SAM-dependent methyltransferase